MNDLTDTLGMSGEVHISTFDGDLPTTVLADLPAFLETHPASLVERNLVPNSGRSQMVKLIVQATTLGAGYIAVSTASITPALADTTLPSEFNRGSVNVKQSYLSVYQRYIRYNATTDWASTSINSVGLFDTATTGGNMFAEASASISKLASQSLVIDWRILAST